MRGESIRAHRLAAGEKRAAKQAEWDAMSEREKDRYRGPKHPNCRCVVSET